MKRVALVLSSGGARGFAHIGAIEELQERGYEIASVAGTSMGALIGGMFAAGKLEQVKERAFALDRKRMFALAVSRPGCSRWPISPWARTIL